MAEYFHGRLFRVLAAARLLFTLAVLALDAPSLILISNALLLSISSGVAVAYMPVVPGALKARRPTKGDYLGLGIFVGWSGSFVFRVVSIVARDLGWPEIANTHWTSLAIFMSLIGGGCHLVAPNAVEGKVPPQRWLLSGCAVAAGVAVMFVLWALHGPLAIDHPPVRLQ